MGKRKTKREAARERLIEAFIEYEQPAMLEGELHGRRERLVDAILDTIVDPPPKPKKSTPSQETCTEIFEAWADAVTARWKHTPQRNAKISRQCKELAGLAGRKDAVQLVRFYVTQNDAFYQRIVHDLSACVRDAHPLLVRMKTGKVVTTASAKKTEAAQTTAASSRNYLQRKYQK